MNAIITNKEISDFIEREYKIRPEFTALDEKTIEISYKAIFLPSIGIKFHIAAVRKDIVCISYDCSFSMITSVIIDYLKEKIPNGINVDTDKKRIEIYPQRLKQLEKVLEYVELSGITFDGDSVNLKLAMV